MSLIVNMLILFSVIGIIYFIIKDQERQKIIAEKGRLRDSLMKDDTATRELLKKLRNNHTTTNSKKTKSPDNELELEGFNYSVRVLG